MAFQTPDVYVREQATLPPSIAEVETAIPAFVGFTEKMLDDDQKALSLRYDESDKTKLVADSIKPRRITSMLEYHQYFGGDYKEALLVKLLQADPKIEDYRVDSILTADKQSLGALPKFFLYQAVSHFFANGGGACYIVPVGLANATQTVRASDFQAGLAAVEQIEEVTMLLTPEAVTLGAENFYLNVAAKALEHAKKFPSRVALIDVVENPPKGTVSATISADAQALRDKLSNRDHLKHAAAYYPYLMTSIARSAGNPQVVTFTLKDDPANPGKQIEEELATTSLDKLAGTARHTLIQQRLSRLYLVLPPCAAIAGVYSQTDAQHGVWKAPANVGLAQVIGPHIPITNDQQKALNVDVTGGKSINAIRAFTGKGTLVWGARTLDGNDNEWRYVNVRRLFNMIEESARKSINQFVFDPNSPFTWLKIKAMVESYLRNLWQQGALFGDKPEKAFFVNVGLGKTMTQQDILEGLMKVEIGIAANRPAEFIVLTFTHKPMEA